MAMVIDERILAWRTVTLDAGPRTLDPLPSLPRSTILRTVAPNSFSRIHRTQFIASPCTRPLVPLMTAKPAKPTMTPKDFAAKWSQSELKERAAYQEHWRDLCAMLEQPTPTEVDTKGDEYCFEKGAKKADGSDGFADVWWRGRFAVEYKAPGKSLNLAYKQLNDYQSALERPPLMMVCDHFNFRIHTNFTNAKSVVWEFTLNDLAQGTKIEPFPPGQTPTAPFELLRNLFSNQDWFHPGKHAERVTREAAAFFAAVSASLERRPKNSRVDPVVAAHFLMKCLFCFFAEDAGILKNRAFRDILQMSKEFPEDIQTAMSDLFAALANGGAFKYERVAHINGGLFDNTAALRLYENEIVELRNAAKLNWSDVEPAIFGTLFERSLDPAQRKRLGAHYTSRADIMLVIEPVILRPLRREWDAIKSETADLKKEIHELIENMESMGGDKGLGKKHAAALAEAQKAYAAPLNAFLDRLSKIKVLDPACGSGNFLYVAMYEMKVLEAEVIDELKAAGIQPGDFWQGIHPRQFLGFEINEYAYELAQTVIWLGYLQWWRDHREGKLREPVLDKLDTIKLKDALLEIGPDGKPEDPPRMTEWPAAEFIVGNPPFIGNKKLRKELGDNYVDLLYRKYEKTVANGSDISVYWHERARSQISNGSTARAGLLATQGIRGGTNQRGLRRICDSGRIFEAWSDRVWILDGAAVQISIVCQDAGNSEEFIRLNGIATTSISPALTPRNDVSMTETGRIPENQGISFQGPVRVGPFDLTADQAKDMISVSGNPNRRPNSDVIVPILNGSDINGRSRGAFVIDFEQRTQEEASLYERPFAWVAKYVKPKRVNLRMASRREYWWRHGASGSEMRNALSGLSRFIGTSRVSKHRIFAWIPAGVLPDSALVVFAREDDYFFGVLHSTPHELWSLGLGTQLREKESGFRYTPTSCFETFPLPKPTKAQERAIAAAAFELNEKRENWLNPPDLVELCSDRATTGRDDFLTPAKSKRSQPDSLSRSKGRVGSKKASGSTSDPSTGSGSRKSKDVPGADLPLDAAQARKELQERTLTNLYNKREPWLHNLHVALDKAVLAAYGWSDINVEHLHAIRVAPMVGEGKAARPATATECAALQKAAETEVLRRLLELNRERSA